ncbi:hypothetical protein [Teichococcus aestuarii]|uniref:hypothetical protein n=1 Tax=Teichococcus aestuarii TaxID=568898 RepID=UPI00361B47D1
MGTPVSGVSSAMSVPEKSSRRLAPAKRSGSLSVPRRLTWVGPFSTVSSTGQGLSASRSESTAPPSSRPVMGWPA